MATASTELNQATKRTVNKVKNGSHRAASKVKQSADTLDGKVTSLAEETGKTLHNLYNSSIEHVEEGADRARDMVQEKPLAALAAAFFGGVVLATLLRR